MIWKAAKVPKAAKVCIKWETRAYLSDDIGDIHVMRRGTNILELLAGENVEGNEMNFSVTVLASLGSGHLDDFAWATWVSGEGRGDGSLKL